MQVDFLMRKTFLKVSTNSRSTNTSSLKVIKTDWSSKAVCYSNEETNLLSNHYHHLTLKRKTSNRSVSGRSVSHLVRQRRHHLKEYVVVCTVHIILRTFNEFRICREFDWKSIRSTLYCSEDFISICLKLMTHQIFISGKQSLLLLIECRPRAKYLQKFTSLMLHLSLGALKDNHLFQFATRRGLVLVAFPNRSVYPVVLYSPSYSA